MRIWGKVLGAFFGFLLGNIFGRADQRIGACAPGKPLAPQPIGFRVVIGGIGSIKGAFVAALMIGVVDTFGKVFLPQASGVLVYLLMASILLWKPDGLFKAG